MRKTQLQELLRGFADAQEQNATVLMRVYGEVGSGKTALLRRLREEVPDGVIVLEGSFSGSARFHPLQPIADCVLQLVEAQNPDRLSLAARIEDLMVGDPRGSDVLLQLVGQKEWLAESQEVFWVVRRLFQRSSENATLVLLLDDVDQGDEYASEFLAYLGLRYSGSLLVVTAAEPYASDAALAGFTWGSVFLHPLSPDEQAEVQRQFPLADYRTIGDEIARVTDGNLLSLVEALTLLSDSLLTDEGPTPEDVIEAARRGLPALVALHLDRLDEQNRDIVTAFAVASQPLTLEQIGTLLALEDGFDTRIQELLRRGLLEYAHGHGYTLRHRAIADHAYASADRGYRLALHLRLADLASALAPPGRTLEFEAHHVAAAVVATNEPPRLTDKELSDRGARLHLSMGELLMKRLDAVVASQHLQTAVDMAIEPTTAERSTFLLAYSLMEYAHYGEALQLVTETLDKKPSETLERRLQAAEILLHGVGSLPMVMEDAQRRLRELIAQNVAAGDTSGEGYAWDALAYMHFLALEGEALTNAWNRARELAEICDDGYLSAKASFQLVQAFTYGPTPVDEAISGALQILDRASSLRVIGAGLMSLAGLYAMEGTLEEAEAAFLRAADIFHEMNVPYSLGIGACAVYLMTDDPQPAVEYLRWDLHRYRSPAYDWLSSRVSAVLAVVLWELGEHDEAASLAEEARRLSRGRDLHAELFWRAVIAKAAALNGRESEARNHERTLRGLLRDCDFLSERSMLLLQVAEIRMLLGDLEESRSAVEEALELLKRKGIRVPSSNLRRLREEVGLPEI